VVYVVCLAAVITLIVIGVAVNNTSLGFASFFFGIGLLGILAFRQFGVAKWVCCHMGWHSPARHWLDDDAIKNDGSMRDAWRAFLDFKQCPWCGYKGQVDSQGNLF
jgi:hypothetical protein